MVHPLKPFEEVTFTGELVLILQLKILERYVINKSLIFKKKQKLFDDKLGKLTD